MSPAESLISKRMVDGGVTDFESMLISRLAGVLYYTKQSRSICRLNRQARRGSNHYIRKLINIPSCKKPASECRPSITDNKQGLARLGAAEHMSYYEKQLINSLRTASRCF